MKEAEDQRPLAVLLLCMQLGVGSASRVGILRT
jgi:hypothetical protein